MKTDSPQFVKDEVTNSVRRSIAREIDAASPMLKSSGNGPVMSGFGIIFKRNKKLSLNHTHWKNEYAPSLRSAACNGQRPQERLHRAGLVESANCLLCGAAVGSLEPRHHCPKTVEARGECIKDTSAWGSGRSAWLSKMDSAPKHLMTTRGLVACPDTSKCKPPP